MRRPFETLLNLIAEKMDLEIIWYKPGEIQAPYTDGKIVAIPENIGIRGMYFLLQVLLHEGYHIKTGTTSRIKEISDKVKKYIEAIVDKILEKEFMGIDINLGGENQSFKYGFEVKALVSFISEDLANIYDDIRVDAIAFKEFPNARYCYYIVYDFITKEYDQYIYKYFDLLFKFIKDTATKMAKFIPDAPILTAYIPGVKVDEFLRPEVREEIDKRGIEETIFLAMSEQLETGIEIEVRTYMEWLETAIFLQLRELLVVAKQFTNIPTFEITSLFETEYFPKEYYERLKAKAIQIHKSPPTELTIEDLLTFLEI